MTGLITALTSLSIHLFWRFKTANSKRAQITTIIPPILLPRKYRKDLFAISRRRRKHLSTNVPLQIRNPFRRTPLPPRNFKQYKRSAGAKVF